VRHERLAYWITYKQAPSGVSASSCVSCADTLGEAPKLASLSTGRKFRHHSGPDSWMFTTRGCACNRGALVVCGMCRRWLPCVLLT